MLPPELNQLIFRLFLHMFAGDDDFKTDDTLKNYANTLLPCVYDDFLGAAKAVLTQKHREKLRGLLEFRFKKNPRYNLSDKKLKMIEKQIRQRAKMLLASSDN